VIKTQQASNHYTICLNCKGLGEKSRKLSKKTKLQYQKDLEQFKLNKTASTAPILPKPSFLKCLKCDGSGLISSTSTSKANTEDFPHVAIIGAGIGGVALAVACLHRGIPFTLYERDANFNERSQGYGLTLQQASKALKGFGIQELEEGVVSTKHVVHTTDGSIVGEWGMRKWVDNKQKPKKKNSNIHIARQSLRLALLNQLDDQSVIKWNHKLIDFKEQTDQKSILNFEVNGELKTYKTDLVVGADGIRSKVRQLIISDKKSPLQYLDCMVILGICPLSQLNNLKSNLLDSETVFQTANGNDRIYMMPYNAETIMWQLSFPISENDAKILNKKGANALKDEAIKRTNWHSPIPEIIKATLESEISGYPVYDRELLQPDWFKSTHKTTLIGDAAHPMSPFKGQGANQALLDALQLAREITKKCNTTSNCKEGHIRELVLNNFEEKMISRSASKVKDSAKAAAFLHSEIAITKGNKPRGSFVKSEDS